MTRARSACGPESYTLFMGSVSHTISVTLYERLNYDFLNDLAPISQIAAGACSPCILPCRCDR